jgi:hypothetical protein
MATLNRRRIAKEPFQIHEDQPEDMADNLNVGSDESYAQSHSQGFQEIDRDRTEEEEQHEDQENQEEDEEHEQEPEQEEECDSDSSDENEPIDLTVQHDMEKLTQAFPDFRKNYRLLKRIGEGTIPLEVQSTCGKLANQIWRRHIFDSIQGRRPPLRSVHQQLGLGCKGQPLGAAASKARVPWSVQLQIDPTQETKKVCGNQKDLCYVLALSYTQRNRAAS